MSVVVITVAMPVTAVVVVKVPVVPVMAVTM